MTDILERLRRAHPQSHEGEMRHEAADEIERLRAALRTARDAALQEAASIADGRSSDRGEDIAAAIRALTEDGRG